MNICLKRILIPFILVVFSSTALSQVDFNLFFIDSTMRVDYFHLGTKETEYFSLDKVYKESNWSGSITNLVDTLNLGEFLVRVFDLQSGRLIYSRGYSTVFNEWQTTEEADRGVMKTFSETVRFPFPKRKVQVTINRRDKQLVFRERYSVVIDPTDPTQIITEKRSRDFEVVTLMNNGDSHKKVDILIVGDGYSKNDMKKFKEDAKHFNDVLFATSPFKERKSEFNVRALCVISEESGIDIPDKNIWRSNALGTMYNTFGSPRYILTEANKELRDISSQVPYDFINILVNDSRYGGGGIYQLFTTTYTIEKNKDQEWQQDYVYIHEFGHSFGGLADEYYSSSTGYLEFYPAGVEPWEPNITRLMEPDNVKWKSLLTKGIEIPTQWGKNKYDSLGKELGMLNRLAPDYYEKRDPIMKLQKELRANPKLSDKVGAFEGAGYMSEGMYRPSLDCRMFSLSLADFDPVCKAAIERQIEFYAK